jgi:hypothetical protein
VLFEFRCLSLIHSFIHPSLRRCFFHLFFFCFTSLHRTYAPRPSSPLLVMTFRFCASFIRFPPPRPLACLPAFLLFSFSSFALRRLFTHSEARICDPIIGQECRNQKGPMKTSGN